MKICKSELNDPNTYAYGKANPNKELNDLFGQLILLFHYSCHWMLYMEKIHVSFCIANSSYLCTMQSLF